MKKISGLLFSLFLIFCVSSCVDMPDLDPLQEQIDDLYSQNAAIEGMIKSLTIIPAYSDGSVMASREGELSLSCIISPASSAKGLAKENFKVIVASAITKAGSVAEFEVSEIQIDETKGKAELKADISSVCPPSDGETLLVALNIKVGKTDFTSAFMAVSVPEPPLPEGVVDLGLSVCWATCNLGASSAEGYGGYYQWAGVEDVASTKINLGWSNCPYHTGTSSTSGWTKYDPGSRDDRKVLEPDDDVAHVKLGGNWRMPTKEEWDELLNTANCSWTWAEIKGARGFLVTSLKPGYTGCSIFLPAAGYRFGTDISYAGSDGFYWASTLREDLTEAAFRADFSASGPHLNSYARYGGLSIRPVYKR